MGYKKIKTYKFSPGSYQSINNNDKQYQIKKKIKMEIKVKKKEEEVGRGSLRCAGNK